MSYISATDKVVGKGGKRFFKADEIKRRIAFVPKIITKSDIKPSEAEVSAAAVEFDPEDEAAKKKSQKSKAVVAEKEGLYKHVKGLMESRPPGVEKWVDDDGETAFLFPGLWVERAFYMEGVGMIPTHGISDSQLPKEPFNLWGVAIIEYECDKEGKVVRDDSGNLEFIHTIWGLNDAKINAWKKHWPEHPLISSDFTCQMVQQGKGKRVEFLSCGACEYREDDLLQLIVNKGRDTWKRVEDHTTQKTSKLEVMQMSGIDTGASSQSNDDELEDLMGD